MDMGSYSSAYNFSMYHASLNLLISTLSHSLPPLCISHNNPFLPTPLSPSIPLLKLRLTDSSLNSHLLHCPPLFDILDASLYPPTSMKRRAASLAPVYTSFRLSEMCKEGLATLFFTPLFNSFQSVEKQQRKKNKKKKKKIQEDMCNRHEYPSYANYDKSE